jgi:hypothetical protein
MRKTKQTSLHLEKLGPFFIGRALWQKADTQKETQKTETQKTEAGA